MGKKFSGKNRISIKAGDRSSVSLTKSHRSFFKRCSHMRAPNLQLLIVILPDVTGHYGLRAKYSA